MIKLSLVLKEHAIRERIHMILTLDEDIEIVSESNSLLHLLDNPKTDFPDIILLDISPFTNNYESISDIKRHYPKTKLVIFTDITDKDLVLEALCHGADGYLLTCSDTYFLHHAIQSIFHGYIQLDPFITTLLVNTLKEQYKTYKEERFSTVLPQLTKREHEIVQLIAKGKNNKEIANSLYIAQGTVKNYISRILSKLELHSRTEIAIYINQTYL